jgi:hypothetical protein
VVVADGEAAGGVLLDAAEALGDALPDWLQRLVAGGVRSGRETGAFGRGVVDGDEHRDLALLHRPGGAASGIGPYGPGRRRGAGGDAMRPR